MRAVALWVVAAAGCSSGGSTPRFDLAGMVDGGAAADLGGAPGPDLSSEMADLSSEVADLAAPGGDLAQAGAPRCTVTVLPLVGTVNDMFTATLASTDANACTLQLDNGQPMAVPCNTQIKGGAQLFGGVGKHTAIVQVMGPGGQGQCSASWTITDAMMMPPTCTVTVLPKVGKLADNYTATLTSANANACSYQLDNGNPMAVPCNGQLAGTGAMFGGVGMHVATVAATGPGGATSCVAGWTINP